MASSEIDASGSERQGIVYAVIIEPDGPFSGRGEIVVGALVPGGHIREIGGIGRKPVKWDCKYEVYNDIIEAVKRSDKLTHGYKRDWVYDAIESERKLHTDS